MFKRLERRHYRKFFYYSGVVVLVAGYHLAVIPLVIWAVVHFGVAVALEEKEI